MTDVISGLMDLMRVHSTAFIAKNLTAPWGIRIEEHEHLARFHLVISGSTWIGIPGSGDAQKLEAGDIAIIPEGKVHDYFDDSAGAARDIKQYPVPDVPGRFEVFDKESEDTHLLCGYFEFSEYSPQSVIGRLPDMMIGRRSDAKMGKRFDLIVDLAIAEIADPETLSQTNLNRLTEMLCVITIQSWFEENFEDQQLFEALSDPRTTSVIDAIHKDPMRNWTVAELSKIHGQSRTAFGAHFKAAMGISPMGYVRQWRINQACQMLIEGSLSLDEIAFKAGYADTNAFNRAFKREIGMSPGAYRMKS